MNRQDPEQSAVPSQDEVVLVGLPHLEENPEETPIELLPYAAYDPEKEGKSAEIEVNPDAVTALPGHEKLTEAMDSLIKSHAGRFSLLFLDVDGLKTANDESGSHARGNELLREFSNTIFELGGHSVPQGAPLVGRLFRLHGDEYCLLSGHNTEEGAAKLAQKLETALDNNNTPASIGAKVHAKKADGTFETSQELLDAADALMYKRKEQRKAARRIAKLEALNPNDREAVLESDRLRAAAGWTESR